MSPWRPDWSQHRPDPRVAPYRGRVAHLHLDGEEVGVLLVRVEPYATVESGRLWWRRWSPSYDLLWLFVVLDGRFSDHVVPREGAERELAAFRANRFELYGEVFRVEWTTPEASARLRVSEFGVDDSED